MCTVSPFSALQRSLQSSSSLRRSPLTQPSPPPCHRLTVLESGSPSCHSPTCTICTRTCSAPPPSVPPTPSLSFSLATTPSPSRSSRSASPHAPLLAVRFPSSNGGERHDDPSGITGFREGRRRRRGYTEERDEAEGTNKRGCGRVVCKRCCYENVQG